MSGVRHSSEPLVCFLTCVMRNPLSLDRQVHCRRARSAPATLVRWIPDCRIIDRAEAYNSLRQGLWERLGLQGFLLLEISFRTGMVVIGRFVVLPFGFDEALD